MRLSVTVNEGGCHAVSFSTGALTMIGFGTSDMFSPLERVLLRTPTTEGAFVSEGHWRAPDGKRMLREHVGFVALLRSLGCEVIVEPAIEGLVDAVYVHDPVLMTPFGALLLNMKKPIRANEPAHMLRALERLEIPIVGELSPKAFSDGGDKVWLDERTLVVGRGYRTNDLAIEEMRVLLAPRGVSVVRVDMPHFRGPGDVLHLMSVLSPIDHDLAVVYETLAPVALLELLAQRGIQTLTVDEDEFLRQGANVLAVGPRHAVVVRGNEKIAWKLADAGAVVHPFDGDEVAVKGDGGPTCLTQPLARRAEPRHI